MRWLLLSVLLVSCGKFKEDIGYAPPYDNDLYDLYDVLPEFQPYVEIFKAEAKLREIQVSITPITIKFDVLGENILGLCTMSSVTEPVIDIDKVKWQKLSNCDREQLLMHEFGHCILRRNHVENMLSETMAENIMHPIHLGCEVYSTSRDYYLDELFSRRNEITFGLYQ